MLTEEDRAILEFERGWWLEPGPKDQAIEFTLGLPAAAYYELLIEMLGRPDAARFDPLTVARLRAMIDAEPVEEAAS